MMAHDSLEPATMSTILILNGPNLNLLGQREPSTYGSGSLADLEALCVETARSLNLTAECHQSNHEGVLLDHIHAAGARHSEGSLFGIVLNAGAFSHTSIALHDAIKGISPTPVVEVKISNVHARESFRHHSWISSVAAGIIIGLGFDGYRLAIHSLAEKAKKARIS
jgi:3-dehydroquinate dehydratase-2